MEAAYYGLANQSQVMGIYDWMQNEPSPVTGLKDTYSAFQFAPRATTEENINWWYAKVDTTFGTQVQDGGAILYTTGFDIRARAMYLGADDAFQRLEGLLDRYAEPDHLTGGSPRS